MKKMSRLFLFLTAILIVTFGCGDSAEATGFMFYANPNDGSGTYTGSGGYDALAEYGPDHVLATLQGDAYQVGIHAYLDYYYIIPLNSTISVTYSLSGEGTALNNASLNMAHSVLFYWHYIDVFPTYPSYLGGSSYSYNWSNEGDYKHDSWEYLDQTFTYDWGNRPYYPHIAGGVGNLFLIKMAAKVSAGSYDRADAFYSSTMYADPIVTANGSVIAPLGGYYATTPFGESGGQYTNPLDPVPGPDPVPEPSTILLLGSGLVSFVGTRIRKRLKK